jgi:flagellar M-ring protein FliF
MNPFADLVRNLGPVRLAALAGIAIAVIGFFIFLVSRLSTGSMSLLYADLDPADSGAIVRELDSRNIPYQLKAGGTQVFVPADQMLNLRVSLAEQGLPGGGSMGYEIFDESQGLGTTSFVQNVNLVRALEGELSRTISSIRNVRGARVHLVLPRRELFSREQQEPSASVVLQLQGTLRPGKEEILSIQHLVAAAVPQLTPEGVSILDDRGQLLARGFGEEGRAALALQNAEEMRRAYEERMRRSIEELVERTVGLGRVRAEVSADIDYDRVVESQERYDPDTVVARSTQTVEETSRESETAGEDTVTVENNLPESNVDGGGTQNSANREESRTEEISNFEISRTVTERVKETGQVNRLSVAVLVDGTYSRNDDGDRVYQPRSQDQLDAIETLVKSAIGFSAERQDVVEVVNMEFVKLEPGDLDDGSLLFGISKEELLQLAEVLVLAVVGLLVILLVVRPVLTRLFESMPTTLTSTGGGTGAILAGGSDMAQLAGPGATADMAELLEGEEDAEESLLDQMIDINQVEGRVRASSLRKIGEIVDKHPEEAVAIIRNWMYQEGAQT